MKMWKVFVDGIMKRTLMEPNRLMILALEKHSEIDVVCDTDGDLQSFTTKRCGTFQLSLNKEGAFKLSPLEEDL